MSWISLCCSHILHREVAATAGITTDKHDNYVSLLVSSTRVIHCRQLLLRNVLLSLVLAVLRGLKCRSIT